jgi:predicted flap endonuclease-1-like 5' DNA nuclease
MRSDYILYAVAIVFFIVTAAVATYAVTQQLWIVTTAVIGLAFIGLGYTQRPKPSTAPVVANVPPPPPSPRQESKQQPQQKEQAPTVITPPPQQPILTDVVKLEDVKPIVQPLEPPVGGLTDVKGIGEKRGAQLKALGINSVEDLAKASAKDLAAKLNVSPKITTKWIENAKEIGRKP